MSTTIFNHTFHIEYLARKAMEHISFSFDPIASTTAVLVVLIAFLQWRSSRKQYKQNLFKMRLEHYTKVKAFLNVLVDFQVIQNILLNQNNENSEEFDKVIKKIKETVDKALIETGELNFLFGRKIGAMWTAFFMSVYEFANTITQKTSEEEIIDKITELNKQQIKIFNSFNKKLNL